MCKHEGTPKGGETRVVPMSGRLHRALAQHQMAEGGAGRVLPRVDGSDMTTDSQRRILRRVTLYAGLPAGRPLRSVRLAPRHDQLILCVRELARPRRASGRHEPMAWPPQRWPRRCIILG